MSMFESVIQKAQMFPLLVNFFNYSLGKNNEISSLTDHLPSEKYTICDIKKHCDHPSKFF